MDFDNLKKVLTKKMNPAWVWVLLATVLIFAFIVYSYLVQPKYIPEQLLDFSKKIVNEIILGDKDWRELEKKETKLVDVDSGNDNGQSKNDGGENTSDWQTYENENFGFSLKYPKDWTFRKGVNERLFFMKSIYKDVEAEFPTIEVSYFDFDTENVDNWLDQNKDYFIGDQLIKDVPEFSNRKDVRINGRIGKEFVLEGMGQEKNVVLVDKSKIFVFTGFSLGIFENDNEFGKTFFSILKSF